MSLRVLRVLTRMNVGGPARHVLRIESPLANRGIKTLLVTGSAEAGEGDLVGEAREQGMDVHCIEQLERAVNPWRDPGVMGQLRRLLVGWRPDIIHTHAAKAGFVGRLAARSLVRRPRIVHTFHGHVLDEYFSRPVSTAFALIERTLARCTDRLVAVSPEVRDDLLLRHRIGRASQWAVVPSGLDRDRVAPNEGGGRLIRKELGVEDGDVLVGFVGRLATIKGVDLALEAFGRLWPRYRHAHFLLVGDGPEGDRVRKHLPLTPGTHWLPWQEDLGAIYAALDLLVLPSRAEGLPQVVLEAHAAGVPVVATSVGGVPGLIQDGQDGALVAPGDLEGLESALELWIGQDDLRQRGSVVAQGHSREAHAPEAVAGALADLYEEITHSHGALRETSSPLASPRP